MRCQAVLLQEEPGLQCWSGHGVTAVQEHGWGGRAGTLLPALEGQSRARQPLCSSDLRSSLDLCELETATSPEAWGVRSPQLLGPVIGDISAHVHPCLGPAAVCFPLTPHFPLHGPTDLVLSWPKFE